MIAIFRAIMRAIMRVIMRSLRQPSVLQNLRTIVRRSVCSSHQFGSNLSRTDLNNQKTYRTDLNKTWLDRYFLYDRMACQTCPTYVPTRPTHPCRNPCPPPPGL